MQPINKPALAIRLISIHSLRQVDGAQKKTKKTASTKDEMNTTHEEIQIINTKPCKTIQDKTKTQSKIKDVLETLQSVLQWEQKYWRQMTYFFNL